MNPVYDLACPDAFSGDKAMAPPQQGQLWAGMTSVNASDTYSSDLTTSQPVRRELSKLAAEANLRGCHSAVVVLKLNDLGQINCWSGYEAGDYVIQEVVRRIRASLPDGRLIGRMGGGCFLAFTRIPSERSALGRLIDGLISRVSSPVDLPTGELPLNCRVGVSLMPQDAIHGDELLRNAELAVRHAKCRAYAFYSEQLRAHQSNLAVLQSALVGALDRQEFQLAYQPQVCLETGKVFGVEALLRWHSPELGQVPPDRFVPVAEKTGLMPELGDWVLVSAVRQARRWMEAGTPLRVSVNISATQMQTGTFPARIQQILRRNKVPAAMIELEVTESMLIDNVEQNRTILEEIRQSGVKLALDDFGTGYSNLAYLQHFVFDTLKIDRLFTKSLSGNDSRDVLVRAIIATGRELVSDIIAEGVETEEQKQVLQKLGCSKMQGYLFGRPMTAEDVELQINSESQY